MKKIKNIPKFDKPRRFEKRLKGNCQYESSVPYIKVSYQTDFSVKL